MALKGGRETPGQSVAGIWREPSSQYLLWTLASPLCARLRWFDTGVVANVDEGIRRRHAGDPVNFFQSNVTSAARRAARSRARMDGSDQEIVWLDEVINLIGRDESGGAGDVLNDHVGIAGQILGQIRRDRIRAVSL